MSNIIEYAQDFEYEQDFEHPCDLSNESNKKQMLINVIKKCLTKTDNVRGTSNKCDAAYTLFEWIALNLWFLENHNRFFITVKNKLVEFEKDPAAQLVTDNFSWIKDLCDKPFKRPNNHRAQVYVNL